MLDEKLRSSYLKEMGITCWQYHASRQEDSIHQNPSEQFSNRIDNSSDTESKPVEFRQAPSSENTSAIPDSITWDSLLADINCCNQCHLCQSRHQIVPGVGDRQADWLFVGEGPGYFEDQKGEPFVGRSGKLLDNMMSALFLKRGENVYIANIIKCRASENGKDRQPTEEECATCMPFLKKQIALINPKIIVALGKTAATALLNTGREVTLSSLRRRTHYYQNKESRIPTVVTYHPSYLLRTPLGKQQAWQDLLNAVKIFNQVSGNGSDNR